MKILTDLFSENEPAELPQWHLCQMCKNTINEPGYCEDCQKTIERGYQISSLAGRCVDGAERDSGTLYHARDLRRDGAGYFSTFKAFCGAEPGKRSAGWSTYRPKDRQVTCPRCLKKLNRLQS